MKITCTKCFTEVTVNSDNFNKELLETSEREMGSENFYEINSGEIICNNCKTNMSVQFNVWEYPIGVINYFEQYETNGVITELPDFSRFIIDHE
ncbi:hypothetical protein HX071_16535 [Myroides marinus]|uniref:hypothetical protein n=1 Tax=Myroides marinus TaxID=703342 RepID=UPI002577D8DA|nr:hypothetical protein [Myroides marinus]MDM1503786.1 hypothetical protein [Myroides marinus]